MCYAAAIAGRVISKAGSLCPRLSASQVKKIVVNCVNFLEKQERYLAGAAVKIKLHQQP